MFKPAQQTKYIAKLAEAVKLRAKIAALEAQLEPIEDDLLDAMQAADHATLSLPDGRSVSLVNKQKPVADDWGQIQGYIIANNCPELLERRLSASALQERLAAGEKIAAHLEPSVSLRFSTPKKKG
jgi:hypothetical protein